MRVPPLFYFEKVFLRNTLVKNHQTTRHLQTGLQIVCGVMLVITPFRLGYFTEDARIQISWYKKLLLLSQRLDYKDEPFIDHIGPMKVCHWVN